jgi:signal transduction histidine kinase
MAEERERRNLALELHDNLGQLLAVIKIRLCSLDQTPQTGQVSALTNLIHQAETTVRGITQQLSPPVLHALGLAQGLEWLGEEIERVYGLRVHVDHEVCGVHPTPEVQAVLYRSVRELLINVAKHAAADEASLTFLCKHGTLSLVVSDAGCGFDAARVRAADPEQGFGLRSIGERLRYLGGEIEIDSGPGSGTTVTLSMPCASRTEGGCGDTRDAG